MQHYSKGALTKIRDSYYTIEHQYLDLSIKITSFIQKLKNPKAKEYFQHGVNRRLGILYRCIKNIFILFPPDRVDLLEKNERIDIEINLHSFLINVYGLIENIALALAYENDLIGKKHENKLEIKQVNLFNKKFQIKLNNHLRNYLVSDNIVQWYKKYVKNYRDALAHRIPPYIPPATLNSDEQKKYKQLDQKINKLSEKGNWESVSKLYDELERIGKPSLLFLHSFSEQILHVYLHPQLLTDFATIEELIQNVITYFYCDKEILE